MAKKEINIFGTSFLDLLSGALAAVIILFVIVPKKTQADVDIIEKFKEVEVIASDIEDLTEKLKNSVPKEVLEQIQTELSELEKKIEELQNRLSQLEADAKVLTDENRNLKQTVQQQQEEIEELKKQLAEATGKIREAEKSNSKANTVEKTLGVFAKFGILCRWEETNADVDIGIQRFGANPEQCWRMYPSKPWGILGEDVRERDFDEEERFELYYVPKIYPDVYTAWVNIYEKSSGQTANVMASLIFHPGKSDEQRYEIGPIQLSGSRLRCFVTFQLNDYGFTILEHKEPYWGEGRVIK